MSRPKKIIEDPKKRKAHEAALKRRRERNAHERSLKALQGGEDGGVEFEKLIEIEKAKGRPPTPAQVMGKLGGQKSPKMVAAARENLTLAFDLMGGVPALVAWGRKNPTEFYRLWSRLIPKESVEVSATLPLEALLAKLSNHESMSVGEAAYQIGSDIMQEARYKVIEHDNAYPPVIDDED